VIVKNNGAVDPRRVHELEKAFDAALQNPKLQQRYLPKEYFNAGAEKIYMFGGADAEEYRERVNKRLRREGFVPKNAESTPGLGVYVFDMNVKWALDCRDMAIAAAIEGVESQDLLAWIDEQGGVEEICRNTPVA
jgi:hypothetical protein